MPLAQFCSGPVVNKWVGVEFSDEKGVSVDIEQSDGKHNVSARWHVPMFNTAKHNYYGIVVGDAAHYEVIEKSKDPDQQFDDIQTHKTRKLGKPDIASLKEAFGKVKEYRIGQQADTMYPGDDGYDEAMAEINSGRD